MKKIFLTAVLFLFPVLAKAQDVLEKQFAHSESLYNAGNYFDAITEYKRLLFFDSAGDYKYPANYRIGLCYKSGAKFDEAVNYFELAYSSAVSDSQRYDAKIQVVRVNILRRTTERALQILEEMQNDYKFTSFKNDLNYWTGWTYMFADNWVKAAENFAQIDINHPLRTLCLNTEKAKYSVTFAKVISYILPGSGQFYTGNYVSGLMSLAWNGLFGYLTVNSFAENRVFDGIVTGELLWLRFYRGNIQNAGEFAELKNLEIINKSFTYLQNNYEGIKP